MSTDSGDAQLSPELREKQAELRRQRAEQEAREAERRSKAMIRLEPGALRFWMLGGLLTLPALPLALIVAGVAPPGGGPPFGPPELLAVSFALPLLFAFFFGWGATFDFITATVATRRRTNRATGLITGAELEKRPGRTGWTYRPLVRFSFEANGVTMEREFRPRETWHKVEDWNQALLDRYPVGETLVVLWDPQQPLNSMPDLPPRPRLFGRFLFYAGAAGLGLCIWVAYFYFFG